MLPIPTSGVTVPPKRKPVAPTMADAQPVSALPSDMASVVVDVNIMPVQNSVRNTHIHN